MTLDQTAQQLAELLAKATPGEWVDDYQKGEGFSQITVKGKRFADNDASSPGHMVYDVNGCNDGALIVAMKNAIPALLAEREAMKAELTALRAAQQWRPLCQDRAENILLDCLKSMKVPGDDKCLIDEMRARKIWVFERNRK